MLQQLDFSLRVFSLIKNSICVAFLAVGISLHASLEVGKHKPRLLSSKCFREILLLHAQQLFLGLLCHFAVVFGFDRLSTNLVGMAVSHISAALDHWPALHHAVERLRDFRSTFRYALNPGLTRVLSFLGTGDLL